MNNEEMGAVETAPEPTIITENAGEIPSGSNSLGQSEEQTENLSISNIDLNKIKEREKAQSELIRRQQAQIDRLSAQQKKEIQTFNAEKTSKALDPEQFDNHEDYLKALVQNQVSDVVEKNLQAKAELDIRQKHQERMFKKMDQLAQETPDCYNVTFSAEAQHIYTQTPGLPELVESMPNNAEVAYYLGKNIGELQRIASLPPSFRAGEIVRLNQTATPKTGKLGSEAPPPITPVKPSQIPSSKDPAKMSDEEWFAWKEQKDREKRNR